MVVLIAFLKRVLDLVDKECKIKIMIAGLTNVAGQIEVSLVQHSKTVASREQLTLGASFSSRSLFLPVDGILLGLLKVGITDFIRVGSLRRVNPAIVPYMVHMATGQKGKSTEDVSNKPNSNHEQRASLPCLVTCSSSRRILLVLLADIS